MDRMVGLVMAAGFVVGCTSTVDNTEPRCTDPKYGDGVCDLQTSCTAPDIDCFTTFPDQASAQAWWATNPTSTKKPAVPTTEPRYAKVRALLDRGWAAYKATRSVGDLANLDIQLVFVNPTSIDLGAFVSPALDQKTAVLAVFVELPLLDKITDDDQLIAVIMHEIEHALGLHVIPEVKAGFLKFYRAPGTTEPFGLDATDDATARALFTQWSDFRGRSGYLADAELHGFPFAPPVGGVISDIFRKVIQAQAQANPAACSASVGQLQSLETAIGQTFDPLAGSVTVNATLSASIPQVFGQVDAQCFPGVTAKAIDVVAQVLHVTPAAIRAELTPALATALDGDDLIAGFYRWVQDDRLQLRTIQSQFSASGPPTWDRLRYYSTEEAADESSVISIKQMGLPPETLGLALTSLSGIEAACRPLVDADAVISYGEDVKDDHHAMCWRVGKVKRFAARLMMAKTAPMPAPMVLGPMPGPGSVFQQAADAADDHLMN